MAKVSFFVLCENFIFTDGKITLVNIYDTVNAPALPTIALNFTVALGVVGLVREDGENGELNLICNIYDEEGVLVMGAKASEKLPDVPHNVATGINFSGKIQFAKEGPYVARLLMGSEEIASLNFNVKIVAEV